jgi:Pup amidohydrolase
VAVHKVLGIETEYGIIHRQAGESNPVVASSLLINAYAQENLRRIDWDFEDESPGRDARGMGAFESMAPEVETHLVNTVLTNGARYYVDHAHPEISTPECFDALEVLKYDVAAERILIESMVAATRLMAEGEELIVYKNNSDRKGNSYGTHENYLLARQTPFGRIVSGITPHFVTRQIVSGAGKVGTEAGHLLTQDIPFQLSQRADFFEEEVGLETTLKRPIINTRDEPHADSQKYRRLHVIVGDANLAELSTFLKLGCAAIILAMVDDGLLDLDVALDNPVEAIQIVSGDLSLSQPLRMRDGRHMTALEIQWAYLGAAREYTDRVGFGALGGDEVGRLILFEWERVLTQLETDPMKLANELDWVAKLRLFESFQARHDVGWDDPRVAAMDLQYHDMRPAKSLHSRLNMRRLTKDSEVIEAMHSPPERTRAYFRGRCLQKFPDAVVSANWDSMVFDVGDEPLRRVPMIEPLRGTREHVGTLVEESATARDLLERLGS